MRLVCAVAAPKAERMTRHKFRLAITALSAFVSHAALAQTLTPQSVTANVSSQVEVLSRKALEGDTRAQLQLGIAFEFGQGVEKNLDEAMHWYSFRPPQT